MASHALQDEAARQATQRHDAEEARAAFRCELCNKGYSKPSAYETHLTSYDHHHRKVSSSVSLMLAVLAADALPCRSD